MGETNCCRSPVRIEALLLHAPTLQSIVGPLAIVHNVSINIKEYIRTLGQKEEPTEEGEK